MLVGKVKNNRGANMNGTGVATKNEPFTAIKCIGINWTCKINADNKRGVILKVVDGVNCQGSLGYVTIFSLS